jgi:hypothetical protein
MVGGQPKTPIVASIVYDHRWTKKIRNLIDKMD